MAIVRDSGPAANDPPKPPCAACGKPSRAWEPLYWGTPLRHLCDPCEVNWYATAAGPSLPPRDMAAFFEKWLATQKARRAA